MVSKKINSTKPVTRSTKRANPKTPISPYTGRRTRYGDGGKVK